MEAPPNISESDMVVSIIKMVGKLILLLDFEKIVSEINPEINIKLTTVPKGSDDVKANRKNKKIIIAEDSHMLRDLLVDTLNEAGYLNVIAYNDGKAA